MWAGVPVALALADAFADAEALAECMGLSMLVSSMVLWLELDPSDIERMCMIFVVLGSCFEIGACPCVLEPMDYADPESEEMLGFFCLQ